MADPVLRFHRLRLRTNPFEVLETERFLDLLPEPPGLRDQLDGDWRALEFVGPSGSGKTTRLLLSLRLLGGATAFARRGADGAWRFEGPVPEKLDALALDEFDRQTGWLAHRSLPPEASRARRILVAARAATKLPGARTVLLDRIDTPEILAYHRARIDHASTGAAGRYALTPEALHRLHILSEGNYYRMNRILYQAFEGLVRDEPLEEKAIERGYGGYLLEEQESAAERGVEPVVK